MIRRTIFLFIILLTSCTAYRHNYKVNIDEALPEGWLKNLAGNDKVRIRINTGQSVTGKVVSIHEDYMVVQVGGRGKQTIYFRQIGQIKYDVNVPLTAVKIVGGLAVASLILLLIFPPDVGGPFL